MKIHQILLLALAGLMGCQEETQETKVVVQIDEEELAKVIVEQLVESSLQFSHLMRSPPNGATIELPEVADLVESKAEKEAQAIVLHLDEDKLQRAILEGMMLGSSELATSVKLDPLLQEAQPIEAPRQSTKIRVDVTSENQLYGGTGDSRILLSQNFSDDDLKKLQEWLTESTSDTSKNWQLLLIMDETTTHLQATKIIKTAKKAGITQVVFGNPRR